MLAYARPANTDAGVTSFPLAIFYRARIKPITFNALLNGDNISGRFTPEPEGYQIVRIPLAPGLNTLVLSVEGNAAIGQTVSLTRSVSCLGSSRRARAALPITDLVGHGPRRRK